MLLRLSLEMITLPRNVTAVIFGVGLLVSAFEANANPSTKLGDRQHRANRPTLLRLDRVLPEQAGQRQKTLKENGQVSRHPMGGLQPVDRPRPERKPPLLGERDRRGQTCGHRHPQTTSMSALPRRVRS